MNPTNPHLPKTASPCINECRLDPRTGWCRGCLRTIDEISAWPDASEAARRSILEVVLKRRGELSA
ncbi:MAG: DUF1289 domain-containing protein [Propionivibrio sp.]